MSAHPAPQTPLQILIRKSDAAALSAALEIPATVRVFDQYADEGVAALLDELDVFVTTMFRPAWLGQRKSRLRLIHCPGAGMEGIDLAAVPPGCQVCNVYGHEYAIAEYVFMTMAALNRRLFQADRQLRAGDWGDRSRMLPELRQRTLLIVGLGHIGAELARWGRFLGMRVTAVTRSGSAKLAAAHALDAIGPPQELQAFLGGADFVVVAVAQNPETIGLIGDAQLQAMKPTAFLINVARGPIVDEAALFAALRDRRIAGAAIDVWYQYPAAGARGLPSQYPFQDLDNVVMTPTNSGFTEGTMRFRWAEIAANVRRLVAGEPLVNVVWPKAPPAAR